MKCLVAGGAGFIGSHLCEKLLQLGHDVICVDNLITSTEKNIVHLQANPHFRFVKHDITKLLPADITADIIFHLASPASPPKYAKYAIETLLVNTYGTYLLLEKSVSWPARFIFASTSEVYGDPLEHPQKETYWGNVNPVGERSCYDESKRAGEAMVMSYFRNKKVDVTILRIFNTFGPRMDLEDGRVVTNFIKQIKSQQPLTLYGDGSQTRSFCYISDMIEGIVRVLQTKNLSGQIINLGNPEEITVSDLAKRLMKLADYSGKISYTDLPPDDPVRRKPDISQAQRLLNWQPQISLDEGLKKTLAYYGGISLEREA